MAMITEPNNFLDKILNSITPIEQHRTDNRMLLAAKIADAMQSKKISSAQLAKQLGKSPSVITKWLSGTHNFTSDTLSDIEFILDIKLLQVIDNQPIILKFNLTIIAEVQPLIASSVRDDANTLSCSNSFSLAPKKQQAYC
jgi:transcriptional regulator with XRE-family HTH domain